MGPHANAALGQLVVQRQQAVLKPRAFDSDLEVLEAKLQQLLVGQCGPGKFATRHGASKADTQSWPRWCHERLFSTTGRRRMPDSSLQPVAAMARRFAGHGLPSLARDQFAQLVTDDLA